MPEFMTFQQELYARIEKILEHLGIDSPTKEDVKNYLPVQFPSENLAILWRLDAIIATLLDGTCKCEMQNMRGVVVNAFERKALWRVKGLIIDYAGSGFMVGDIARCYLYSYVDKWILPPLIKITEVGGRGELVSYEIVEAGWATEAIDGSGWQIWSENSYNNAECDVFSDSLHTQSSVISDIQDPQENDTCVVLTNEMQNNESWMYIYKDDNGDGIFRWREHYKLSNRPLSNVGENFILFHGVVERTNSVGSLRGDCWLSYVKMLPQDASMLNLAGSLSWEKQIFVKNTGTSAFTIPFPNTNIWQLMSGTSIEVEAGETVEIIITPLGSPVGVSEKYSIRAGKASN